MIEKSYFDKMPSGEEIFAYTLKNSSGASVKIITLGGRINEINVPDKNGNLADVICGFDNAKDYLSDSAYQGALIGRFGNRIEKGEFTLNGKTYKLAINNGPNHLHGGLEGFSRKMFTAEMVGDNAVCFAYTSPDGEENYPGNLEVKVTYSLTDDGDLSIDYNAVCDSDTIINLTNHSYFNPSGCGEKNSINDLYLSVKADAFCDIDADILANGDILAVRNTPFDLRNEKLLGCVFDKTDFAPMERGLGIDHNFVLSNGGEMMLAATLYSEKTGIEILCNTNQPGVQVYTSNFLTEITGKDGKIYEYRGAICLETQGYPNATSFSHFPSPVLKKGEIYSTKTSYKLNIR